MSGPILSIDTSTPRGGVSVVAQDGSILFEKTFTSERSHNSQLFAPLGEALDACGSSPGLIVVGTGPASYTGVRIGIAAAQGIAMARRIPLVGLPSVLAPDADSGAPEFCVCGDARRGSYFIARVKEDALDSLEVMDAGAFQSQYEASTPELAWYTFDARSPLALPRVSLAAPCASKLGIIASRLPAGTVAELASRPLEPLYLAPAFITQPKPRPTPGVGA